MSVVIGQKTPKGIVIIADSLSARGWSKETHSYAKLTADNDIIIGGAGWSRETQLMFHFIHTHKPRAAEAESIMDFILEFILWKDKYTKNNKLENEYIMAFGNELSVFETNI